MEGKKDDEGYLLYIKCTCPFTIIDRHDGDEVKMASLRGYIMVEDYILSLAAFSEFQGCSF